VANLSTTIILKALDCLSLRAAVSAENIANAGTPGYRPLRVSFEKALIKAAGAGRAAVKALQPQIEQADASGPAGLRLDLEVATASATAMRYAALVEILNRRMQQDSQSVSGNA
jgi:flagellar basal-body rod protein FlgB